MNIRKTPDIPGLEDDVDVPPRDIEGTPNARKPGDPIILGGPDTPGMIIMPPPDSEPA